MFEDVMVINNQFVLKSTVNGWPSLVKTDIEGNVLWVRGYSSMWASFNTGADSRLHQTSDGGFVFVNGIDISDGALYKTDSVGNLLFSKQLVIGVEDVVETAAGEYFVMGIGPLYIVKKRNYNDGEIGFIQLDSLGDSGFCVWNYSFPDTSYFLLTDTLIFTTDTTGMLNAFEVKIDSTPIMSRPGCVDMIGAVKTHNDLTEVSVFPNPSGGIFTFEVKSGGKGRIVIYNSLGVPLMNVLSVNRKTSIDLSGKQPGIYFYKFTDKYGKTAKGKIIIR